MGWEEDTPVEDSGAKGHVADEPPGALSTSKAPTETAGLRLEVGLGRTLGDGEGGGGNIDTFIRRR